LQTVRHHFNIYASSCVTLALCRGNQINQRNKYRKLVTRFGVIRRIKWKRKVWFITLPKLESQSIYIHFILSNWHAKSIINAIHCMKDKFRTSKN